MPGYSNTNLFGLARTTLPILIYIVTMRPLSPPTRIPEKPVFVGFDDDNVWRVPGYRRNLPHWRMDGATYFVTFRLADSLPHEVLARWQEEDHRWLRSHGIDPAWRHTDSERFDAGIKAVPEEERAPYEKQQQRRFLIELDQCHGACYLKQLEARRLTEDALAFFHGARVWLGDFVVMPNHAHVLVQPFPGVKLEEWLYSVKRYTGRRVGEKAEQIWQEESFDRVVRDEFELARIRAYIEKNPAKLRNDWFTLHRATWLDEFLPK